MKHDDYERILSVSAILRRQDSCLLVCRGKSPNLHKWSFPGGRVIGDESLRCAAERELFEETGLCVSLPYRIGHYSFSGDRDMTIYDIHVFMGFWVSGEACAGDDAVGVRWVLMDDLLSGRFCYPTTSGLRSVLRDAVYFSTEKK